MVTTKGGPERGASGGRQIHGRGPAVGEALDHGRHIAVRVDKTGIAAHGAAGTVTGSNGARVEFAVGGGERDGASGEHPRVEHTFHVQGGRGGDGGRAGDSVSCHGFVQGSLQACDCESSGAGQGGDKIDNGAKPEYAANAECCGVSGWGTGGR